MKKILSIILFIISLQVSAQLTYTSEWGSAITTGNYNAASNTIVRSLITNNATNGSAGLFIRNGAQTLRLFMDIDSAFLTSSRPVVLPQNLFFKASGSTGDVLTRGAGGKLEWQTPSGSSAAGSTGMVQFNNAAAFAADSAFYWDNTNKRLGLREFAPAATLDIRSSTNTSLSTALRVGGSSSNDYLCVKGDGRVLINSNTLSFTGTNNTRLQVGTNDGNVHSLDVVSSVTSGGQATFLRIRNDVIAKGFQWDNGTGGIGANLRSNSSATQIYLENGANTTEQIFEIRDPNTTGRLLAAAGNNRSRLVFVRSGTISIGLYDTNADDSFWNPFGTRTFIFGATTRTNASALVEMTSTNRGFLPPRNTNPASNISSPATGLIVFNTTTNKLQVYDGTNWIDLH